MEHTRPIAPLFTIDETVESDPNMRVYTPLELAGRNIYMREGCYACHSQMVRTLQDEVERYGPYSLAVESKYDHPMLWGSKRTGPDLAREGGARSDSWHYVHLLNPRMNAGSRMPSYTWLAQKRTDFSSLPGKIAVQQRLGVPYPIMTPEEIEQRAREQALEVAGRIVADGLVRPDHAVDDPADGLGLGSREAGVQDDEPDPIVPDGEELGEGLLADRLRTPVLADEQELTFHHPVSGDEVACSRRRLPSLPTDAVAAEVDDVRLVSAEHADQVGRACRPGLVELNRVAEPRALESTIDRADLLVELQVRERVRIEQQDP